MMRIISGIYFQSYSSQRNSLMIFRVCNLSTSRGYKYPFDFMSIYYIIYYDILSYDIRNEIWNIYINSKILIRAWSMFFRR